jgi:hypothetical protein
VWGAVEFPHGVRGEDAALHEPVENGYTDALKQFYDASVDIERAVGIAGR